MTTCYWRRRTRTGRYDIVAQGHAGSITVDSETDGGSTFIETLPSSGQS